MAKGYMLSGEYLTVLADMIRWWRGNRYELKQRRGVVRRPLAHQISRFELAEDLEPGGTAKAVRLVPDGDGWKHAEPEHEVVVRDGLGTTRGKKALEGESPSDEADGTHVVAYKAHDHADWEIVEAQPWPLMIRGKLTDDLDTTDGTFKIDGVVVLQPVGAIDVGHIVDGSDEVTVHNIFSWEGDDNGNVMAVWNEEDTRWEAVQVECP